MLALSPKLVASGWREVAVGLGSSLGDRHRWLELATLSLVSHPHIRLLRASRWVRTPPMRGGTARGWFLNGVLRLETALDPEALLTICRRLEEAAGRRRSRYWGDRTLDVDLLHAADLQWDSPTLTLPHPGLPERRFALEPLIEVWPDAVDPRTGRLWSSYLPAPGPRPSACGSLPPRWLPRSPSLSESLP